MLQFFKKKTKTKGLIKSKQKPTVSDNKKPAASSTSKQGCIPNSTDVVMRGSWDRKQYKRALTVAGASATVSFALLLVVVLLILMRPEPKYFSVTNDFRVIELSPLNQPYISNAGLLNWSSEVITRTFSLDFLHFRRQLGDVRKHYAPDAFKQLIAALKSSGIIDMIKGQRLSVSVVIEKAPVITATGVLQGVMSWKIEIPIVASYESSKGVETTQHLNASMLVQRGDLREHPEGVLVKQVVLR